METLPEHFIIADIETTGLSAERDRIIEIAAIRVSRNSELNQTFTVLVNPGRKLPAKIVQITGITDDMLHRDGCEIDEAIAEFLEFVGEDMLVFYNAPFDIAFLEKAAGRIGRQIPNKVCCALRTARAAWPGRSSYKLSALARDAEIDTEGAHRALVDCRMTMTIYVAAVVETGRVGYLRGRGG